MVVDAFSSEDNLDAALKNGIFGDISNADTSDQILQILILLC